MNQILSKVAYLHGLAEGLEMDASSAEGRVLSSMIDVLGEMAEEMERVVEGQQELNEYVEDLDFDLGSLEETLFAADDEDRVEHEIHFHPDVEIVDLDDDGEMDMVTCPECGETERADHLDKEIEMACPKCGTVLGEEIVMVKD